MSVSWGTQYAKLKTNLRLAANRLKLLQKKKTEMALKARTEIAEFLNTDKEDRARIRVESIIREDFVVEAYELLEMFCELLLARFGMIQQMKELEDGIAEAVSSLIWVAPRVSHEITEFKVINDQLTQKYGKQFAEAARMNQLPEPSRVAPKLVQKLSVSAPSKLLVEKYLIEIARCAGINFTPDERVMRNDDDEIAIAERNLMNFKNEEQIGWNVANKNENVAGYGYGGGGSSGIHSPPPQYAAPLPPPSISSASGLYPAPNVPPPTDHNTYEIPTNKQLPGNYEVKMPPNPRPGSGIVPSAEEHIYESPPEENENIFPKFPDPPSDFAPHRGNNGGSGGGSGFSSGGAPPKANNTGSKGDDLDFDDLAKRFDELKKRL